MASGKSVIRELRSPLGGTFHYISGCGDAGRAEWLNISRTGASVRLGRYLRPGHVIQLVPAGTCAGHAWSIVARIVWCTRISGTLQFRAGILVDRDCPETALQFATLGYEALAMNKSNSTIVTTAGWPAGHAAPASALHKRLSSLTQAV